MKPVAIGEMVQMVLRGGDIDNRASARSRAEEGKRVHKQLQDAYGPGWEREVSFSKDLPSRQMRLQGRADGIFERRTVHEIKSTRRVPEDWDTEGHEVHWAQAACYGWVLAEEERLDQVELLLTYYNERTKDRVDFKRTYTREALNAFVEDLLDRYGVWHRLQLDWVAVRDESLRATAFPHAGYRPGQRKLAAAVYTTIRDGRRLMVEAPTGVGKTISTLFPALKAMGEGHADRIFYLTAKAVARTVAEEAAQAMRRAGSIVRSVTLTARDKICFTGESRCNPVDCPYAKGHYDRVNTCLTDALETEPHLNRERISAYAEKHGVCPFELAFDLALFADVIICDYNYVFDPMVRLQRFFSEVSERYVVLADEGHNLGNRARDMYSAAVTRDEITVLRRAFPRKSAPYRELGNLAKLLKESALMLSEKDRDWGTAHLPPAALGAQVRKSFDQATAYMAETEGFELQREDMERLMNLFRFDVIFDLFQAGSLWVETTRDGGTGQIMCIDPSEQLKSCYDQCAATVVFSATMAPYGYYEEILGLQGCGRLVIESPFPRENRLMLHGWGVDTRLRNREASYEPIAAYLEALVRGKAANYLIFFPSYDYLERVAALLAQTEGSWQLHPQRPGMTEADKEAFLARFEENTPETVLGLAVLGGSFSEGIDLAGGRLEGVAVVGFGTPTVSMENTLIQRYYDDAGKDGYTYAFVYPAINKVVQAVGRLIRTETDKGVILFLDDRYAGPRYSRLFPAGWNPARVRSAEAVHHQHLQFWGRHTDAR